MSNALKPDHIMQFFKYDHLPERMQAVSKPFGDLAQRLVEVVPQNPERTVALRKLLEAKDAAVRALIAVAPLLLALFLGAMLFAPTAALAQGSVMAADAVDPENLEQVAQLLLTGVTSGNGFLIAAGVVLLAVMGLRSERVGKWFPKVGEFFQNPAVSYALPFVVAIALGLVALGVSPTPVTAATALGVLFAAVAKVAPTAIAAYVGGKKVVEAKAIAAEKAAELDTKAEALSELSAALPPKEEPKS